MLVDTNVIVSALVFPGSTPDRALRAVVESDHLVLTETVLAELREVMSQKWPDRLPALRRFLAELPFALLHPGDRSARMRDPKDQPVLDAALAGGVDVIVTGDGDFLALDLTRPKFLTARQYLAEHRA